MRAQVSVLLHSQTLVKPWKCKWGQLRKSSYLWPKPFTVPTKGCTEGVGAQNTNKIHSNELKRKLRLSPEIMKSHRSQKESKADTTIQISAWMEWCGQVGDRIDGPPRRSHLQSNMMTRAMEKQSLIHVQSEAPSGMDLKVPDIVVQEAATFNPFM